MLLLFCLKQCLLSGCFFLPGQSKHDHSHWCGPSSLPSCLQGHIPQGQTASPGQQQPVHSRGLMPICRITGYSMSYHRYVAFSSVFLLLNLALFFLPLSTRPNMKTLCSDQIKQAQYMEQKANSMEGGENQSCPKSFPLISWDSDHHSHSSTGQLL